MNYGIMKIRVPQNYSIQTSKYNIIEYYLGKFVGISLPVAWNDTIVFSDFQGIISGL